LTLEWVLGVPNPPRWVPPTSENRTNFSEKTTSEFVVVVDGEGV